MTWQTWMLSYLTDRGLWPAEAKAVVGIYLNTASEAMALRATDDHAGYPPQMDAIVAMDLDSITREWLDEHKPLHFARPMFLTSRQL